MNIAYVRVSTATQNTDRQTEELKKYEIEKWFIDKTSGKNMDRPEFKKMMNFVREGDTIFFKDFSRVARNTKELLNWLDEMSDRKVRLVSEKEGFLSEGANGRLLITILAALHEFERTLILENQAEGIAIAKQKGKYKGRKPLMKPKNWDEVILQLRNKEITVKKASQELNISVSTIYRKMKEGV